MQVEKPEAMSDEDLKDYFSAAYAIVSGKLTKAKRKELGLAGSP